MTWICAPCETGDHRNHDGTLNGTRPAPAAPRGFELDAFDCKARLERYLEATL